MAALILPSRRVVQPDGPVSVDWSNPLAKGLTQAYRHDFGLYTQDAVSGAFVALSESTGMASSVSVVGKGISRTGSSTSVNQGHFTLPVTQSATGDVTYLVFHAPNAASGLQALLDDDNGTSRVMQFRLNAAATDFIWFNTSGSAFTASVASSVFARSANVSIAVKRGNAIKVFSNGRWSSTVTITGTPRTPAAELREFNRKAATYSPYQGSHSFAAMWSRALSDAEIAALAVNPWQLFKPVERRIWVPASTGGGTSYSLSADVGSYSLTGQDAAFNYAPGAASYTLTADAGSYSLSGQDAGLSYVPGSGSYTLTAEHGVYSLSGGDASVIAGRKIAGGFGSYGLTGQDAGLVLARRVAGDFGSYSISGQDATFTATGAIAYTLTADSGLYSINGQDAGLTGPQTGGLTTPPAGLIPKIWPMTVRYEGKRRRKHPEEEEKRLQEVAEEAVLQASEEASKRAMRASLEASMKAAQLELAAATMDRLLKLAVKVHEEKMEEEELEIALLLM